MPNKYLVLTVSVALVLASIGMVVWANEQSEFFRVSDSEFEILGEPMDDAPLTIEEQYESWQRPPGPLRVGLQVGHWQNSQLPEELKRLIGNTGASGGGKSEWQVNYEIAKATVPLLTKRGITVDLLPATIPPDYLADVFIAIHADGSPDPAVSGFKIASPRRDLTQRGPELVSLFETHYGRLTGLPIDPNVTRNMRGYYAFNWRRYEHSIHPMTPAIILETGFLTSPVDQRILIRRPELAAQAIADAVIEFLKIDI